MEKRIKTGRRVQRVSCIVGVVEKRSKTKEGGGGGVGGRQKGRSVWEEDE